MDARTERIGRNEALFRVVNERLGALDEAFATVTDTFEIVCECGEAACAEQLVVPVDVYARVRDDSARFVVVPGHVFEDTETVVERADGYAVVRKHPGEPEQLAEETDPNS